MRVGTEWEHQTERKTNMSYKHINKKEVGKIAYFYNQKLSIREIAQRLDRSSSTISREIKRNSGCTYHCEEAEKKYQARRQSSRRKRLYEDAEIATYVAEKLLICWSPEQIAGRMRIEKMEKTVLFSSIYRWLNEGLLPRAVELKPHLRHFKK